MEYLVTIDKFAGPLDLLLHLIKQDDLDIYEINIEEIVKQYLDYINKMEEMNLNIASEYLIMAAELLEIKSSMLLPHNEINDEYEEDLRENLIKRLVEYQNFKEVAQKLKECENLRKEYYTKLPSDLDSYELRNSGILPDDIDLSDLMKALEKFMDRKEFMKPLDTKITNKEYSVKIRSEQIKRILEKRKKIEFVELFDVFTKDYIIITFLSILEMAKKQDLKIVQDNNFDKIFLCEVE